MARIWYADLVIAPGDRGVDELLRQRFAIATNVGKTFQIIACGEADDLAGRGILQIPEIELVAVGVETEWQLATQMLLDVVAILLGLFAANGGVAAGLFGFDHGQRLPIFAQQDVIAELMALVWSAWFGHTLWQRSEDVEFFDYLSRVFDVPA